MEIRELTYPEFEALAARLHVTLPIEQTEAWAQLDATAEGRTPWGCTAFEHEGGVVALASFVDYETHGYHYLRGRHAPVWLGMPSAALEAEAVDALVKFVRKRDKKVAFIRCAVDAELPSTHATLSITPYDSTVLVDLAGGDEEILNRMKKRGRRDVRKSLRECEVLHADETDAASADFSEYYEVMRETAARDGFTPAPQADYENTLRILGPEHARVFTARAKSDGSLVSWGLDTISGTGSVHYYAASRTDARTLVTDGLLYFELCELGRRGCTVCDLMGIGSEAFPGLISLNTFKTKFAAEVAHVAPDRDIPVKRALYAALTGAKHVLKR